MEVFQRQANCSRHLQEKKFAPTLHHLGLYSLYVWPAVVEMGVNLKQIGINFYSIKNSFFLAINKIKL